MMTPLAEKMVPEKVVKVFCFHTEPNFSKPWRMKRQYSSFSSGFIIEGKRVLTNAHSLEHHTQVQLKKRGSDTKYLATVLAIGSECDLALLTVKDEEFWRGLSHVEFGCLPTLEDDVSVVGYPIGGEKMLVTRGYVSRIEMKSYAPGFPELLVLQIDAAINSRKFGGPAFSDDGKCIGIAFQTLNPGYAKKIGYLIPTPVIKHFIQDYEKNGAYTGFPILGIAWQNMDNPYLRLGMGMKPGQKGILVNRVEPTPIKNRKRVEPTDAKSLVLQPMDVILSFDGFKIDNDGTVEFRQGECIALSYLISQKQTGDDALVEVLRNSEILEFKIELGIHDIIPANLNDRPPSYYIVAGLVFTVRSPPYLLSEYGIESDEQPVVLSQVLAADINVGYEGIANAQVLKFNGVPVKNLKSLVSMVENCEEKFLIFYLEDYQIVAQQTEEAKAATSDFLKRHYIPSDRSDDLKTSSSSIILQTTD